MSIAAHYKVLWTVTALKELPGSEWLRLDEQGRQRVLGDATAILVQIDGHVWWERAAQEGTLDFTQGPNPDERVAARDMWVGASMD
jgi:hypothetical protein